METRWGRSGATAQGTGMEQLAQGTGMEHLAQGTGMEHIIASLIKKQKSRDK